MAQAGLHLKANAQETCSSLDARIQPDTYMLINVTVHARAKQRVLICHSFMNKQTFEAEDSTDQHLLKKTGDCDRLHFSRIRSSQKVVALAELKPPSISQACTVTSSKMELPHAGKKYAQPS